MTRKICVITGTRAEYGLLYPVMKKIQSSKHLQLQTVVTTMHLSAEYGLTYKEIEQDGFTINEKIENLLSANSKGAICKSTGLAIILLSDTFFRLQPDIILLLGDRFEAHAAATTAMLMNIPIAHIHGGEVTKGAIDEQIRHSITKMSHLHFTSTEQYKRRVLQLGEAPNRIFNTGAPGIDNILNMDILNKESLEKELNWEVSSPTALFTFHPETLSIANVEEQIDKILRAMGKTGINIIFTYANADNGGAIINNAIEEFSRQKEKYIVVKNLGQLKYLSAMKYVDLLVGNTSSGIIEAASFHKPVVNIGNRQQGRLQSGNIIDSDIDALEYSINKALSDKFINHCKKINNIYGNGKSSSQIVKQLECHDIECKKEFNDL